MGLTAGSPRGLSSKKGRGDLEAPPPNCGGHMWSDWINYQLGFSRIAHVTLDPPNHLYTENADGSWTRPMGCTKTEVILKFNWRGRLRLLVSGKVHIVNITWHRLPTTVVGDSFRWEVLPPFDKVDPKLKV